MSVEDVARAVIIVTSISLALSVFVFLLADLTRTTVPRLRASIALALSTLLFIYHTAVALSAERLVFRLCGILGAGIVTWAAYRLSRSSERFFREGNFLADLRLRQLAMLTLWLVLGGPVWAAL
jgi:hypothetical protein